jgi:hypothetical protein
VCPTLCPTWRGPRHGSRAVRPPLPGPARVAAVADPGGHGTDDGRLGLVDFGSSGRLDALEQALVADMLIAIRRRDPAQLRDAVLKVAAARKPLDERGLERALARFISATSVREPLRPPPCSPNCSRFSWRPESQCRLPAACCSAPWPSWKAPCARSAPATPHLIRRGLRR